MRSIRLSLVPVLASVALLLVPGTASAHDRVTTTPYPSTYGTLSGIAAARCGDAGKWGEIAKANGISNPLKLQPFRSLVVPCATPTGTAPTPRAIPPGGAWRSPLASYRITTCYEWRRALYDSNGNLISREGIHRGLDMAAAGGTRVGSIGAGTVIRAGWRGGYGKAVEVSHGDGYTSLYAHLSTISVSTGQRVVAGQRVGGVGRTGAATGNHLHLGMYRYGAYINPTPFLERRGVPIYGC